MARITLRLRELIEERQRREGRAVALEEVAQATGIPVPTLSDLHAGRGDHVTLQWLAELCDYFGVAPNDLLGYEPSAQRQAGEDQPAAVDAREIVERWERDYGQDERPVT